ncbi:hypothetical protein HYH03_015091 [Edaphochlamys debaryana]|uniref:Uncharacterized protein n=1 Tax=Edaphochlamys debaryana TaxID=47281 RepID=A0A836BRM1_9CHLO|nr:hypothetical protein HYH03_015091 [Edaphochlamys debaryana]|eukprot:KAG2486267.1 hypothetical protein HYH03_015091 [Edaphochlamys debaryana]
MRFSAEAVSSHDAGEQRRRDYNWNSAGIDPAQYRFGLTDPNPQRDGVKKALTPALDPELQPPRLLPKLHEDYKATATDFLGRPRALGTGDRPLGPGHTFGVPSMRKGREPAASPVRKTPESRDVHDLLPACRFW